MHVASVATAFPSGQSPIALKVAEARAAVELGADEVDMVIDRGAFLSGRHAEVFDQIVKVREACGPAHLKVILETGELGTYDAVRRASLLAMAAGADFIKTSTGKVSPAATLPVTLCMLEAIRDVHVETGRVVGMKPAGGIRHSKQAIQYLCVLHETLGRDWLTPQSVPLRRVVAPERRPHADPHAEDRRLRVPRPLHGRLTWRSSNHGRRRRASTGRYAPAPESRAIVSLEERYGLYVGGEMVEPRSGEWFATISPATEEPLAEVAQAGPEDVDAAVGAAREGFGAWSELRPAERAKYLFRIARILQERSARAGGRRVARRRKADQGVARRRPAAGRRALLLPRRLGRQARVRLPEPAAAAARRRRPDHPVELPAAHAGVEGGARPSPAATRSS